MECLISSDPQLKQVLFAGFKNKSNMTPISCQIIWKNSCYINRKSLGLPAHFFNVVFIFKSFKKIVLFIHVTFKKQGRLICKVGSHKRNELRWGWGKGGGGHSIVGIYWVTPCFLTGSCFVDVFM